MIYAMSDPHGCYRAYRQALEGIGFSSGDTLYVLGDVIDRGPEPIPLLLDMMSRPNVIPLAGNHEYMAIRVLNRLGVEVTEEAAARLRPEDLLDLMYWMEDGGQTTLEQFRRLGRGEQQAVQEFLEGFSLYEEVSAGGRDYVLVHAGLEPFQPDWPLEAYDLSQMLFQSPDYSRPYFPDRYTVTGHTPTTLLPGAQAGRILKQNRHIAIDCGCVFGGRLGVFCLDTEEEFYVEP